MSDESLRLLVIGAHPDDAEFHAGGLAALYRRHGHTVRFVSVTAGDAGHHQQWGPALAERRAREAAAAAAVIGAQVEVWDHRDGCLEPTLEIRWQVIRLLRTFAPDLVVTHRTCDYHPDHRAVGTLVRDASYLVTVPAIVPEVSIPPRAPVIAAMMDRFTRPAPLAGDVLIEVDNVIDEIVEMLAAHESQVFEWLPANRGIADEFPVDADLRLAALASWYSDWLRPTAGQYRDRLIETYGEDRGAKIEFAEVYEISEYAAPLDAAARTRLFGFIQ